LAGGRLTVTALSIERRDDATVVVSANPENVGEDGRFFFPLTMYWLEALPGTE